jgi:TonB-linked SusC/RagA family outer membrane protein
MTSYLCILKRKHYLASLFLLFTTVGFAQSKTVTGKVSDQSNNASLPGVSVSVKGTTTGVQTGTDGTYSIEVPNNSARLVFSFVGYEDFETAVGNNTTINTTLNLVSTSLDNVVVVGYGTQKKKELTAAADHIGPDDFRQGGARNALDLAIGKVAGLNITRTGGSNPNSGVTVLLRGSVSTSRVPPLYVIDGIPGGNLDLLQQEDIASIDVIKDGAGAAIYGTQANGGVILITTKKGKSGPARYDYANYFRRDYLYRRPDFLSPEEFKAKVASGELKQTDYGNTTDFFDALVNDENISQYHTLAASGGTDKSNYRGSLFYRDLQGISMKNSRREYGGRINFNQKGLNDMLSMSVNLATNFNYANLLGGGGWEDQLTKNPTLTHKNPNGTWYFEQTSTNQLARLYQETNDRQQQTTSIDGRLSLEPIKGLKASVFGSVQRNSYVDGSYRELASESSIETYQGLGYASKNTSLNIDYAFEPTIEYTTNIKGDHGVTGIAGYSYRYSVGEGFNTNNYGFLNDIFEDNNIGTGNQLGLGKAGMGSAKGDNTLIAFFGRLNYAFKGKYLAQFILRREGSSRFGENNKWGNFPAVSAGWNIHEENFVKNVSWLNNLKLRAGYGVTGNQNTIGNYASLVTLGGGGVYLYPDGQYRETYGPNRNPNPDLRWEKKKELNIGVDFGFFKNRLSGAIEVYSRFTEDLLGTYTSPQPPFVRDNILTNVGTIAARGIELTINAIPVRTKDFTWSVDLTGNSTRNWIKEWSNETFKVDYRTYADIGGFGALGQATTTYQGEKIGQFWGKRYAGLSATGDWLFYNQKGEMVPNAQINNSYDKNLTDLAHIGNAIPKLYLQLTNSFNYKNFDLRVFVRGKFGHDILNTMNLSYGNQVSKTNLLRSAFTTYKDIKGTYMYSDYYVEKGDYVKIDELTLGYTFKVAPKYIRNLRVYATGQNLWTITNYTGNDPDFVLDTGLDAGVDGRGPYPSTRSLLVGLNIGF